MINQKTGFQKICSYHVGKCVQEKNFSNTFFPFLKKNMKIRELFYKKKLIINSLMMLEFLQKKEKKKAFLFQNTYIKTFSKKMCFFKTIKC